MGVAAVGPGTAANPVCPQLHVWYTADGVGGVWGRKSTARPVVYGSDIAFAAWAHVCLGCRVVRDGYPLCAVLRVEAENMVFMVLGATFREQHRKAVLGRLTVCLVATCQVK